MTLSPEVPQLQHPLQTSETYLDQLSWNRRTQELKWCSSDPHILPMASGEHDFEPDDAIFRYVNDAVSEKRSAYGPTEGFYEVKEKIARLESQRGGRRVDANQIHFIPSISLACALVTGFLASKWIDHFIFLGAPVYRPLLASIQSHGGSCTYLDFGSSWLEQLRGELEAKRCCLFLVNPHSPTGKALSRLDVNQIASLCEQSGALLLSDDVYSGFLEDQQYTPVYSASEYTAANSITFSGYGKCLNAAGVTASFMICHPRLSAEINRFYGGPILMTSTFSQLMLFGCAHQMCRMPDIRRRVNDGLSLIYPAMDANPALNPQMPDGGIFLWCGVDPAHNSAREFMKESYGIDVLGGEEFYPPSPNFFRITFGSYKTVVAEAASRIARNSE